MKTRLNKDMRNMLLRLARQRVKAPKEFEDAFVATYKVVEKEIKRCCREAFPKREMMVLKKYNAAHQQPFVDLVVSGDTARFDRFQFVDHSWETARGGKTDLPWIPKTGYDHARIKLDDKAGVAFHAYASALAAREKARDDLLRTFETAINHGKTLEDIEAVWPAAREARAFAPNLPTVILSGVYDRMREAVEAKNA
jgi:hypothetical protein